MKYGKLSPELEESASDLEKIKTLLIRWLKKIPSSRFERMSRKLKNDWYEQCGEIKSYSPRYGKSCFLDAVRCAKTLGDVANVFSWLCDSEDILAVFLCSRLSLRHWSVTGALIPYIQNDDVATLMSANYDVCLDRGIKNICIIHDGMSAPVRGMKLFDKVASEDRLTKPECPLLMSGILREYSPDMEPKNWVKNHLMTEAEAECAKRDLAFTLLRLAGKKEV